MRRNLAGQGRNSLIGDGCRYVSYWFLSKNKVGMNNVSGLMLAVMLVSFESDWEKGHVIVNGHQHKYSCTKQPAYVG